MEYGLWSQVDTEFLLVVQRYSLYCICLLPWLHTNVNVPLLSLGLVEGNSQ